MKFLVLTFVVALFVHGSQGDPVPATTTNENNNNNVALNQREVVPLEELQQQKQQKWGGGNDNGQQFATLPAAYPYQQPGYGSYYGGQPNGNPFMQPRYSGGMYPQYQQPQFQQQPPQFQQQPQQFPQQQYQQPIPFQQQGYGYQQQPQTYPQRPWQTLPEYLGPYNYYGFQDQQNQPEQIGSNSVASESSFTQEQPASAPVWTASQQPQPQPQQLPQVIPQAQPQFQNWVTNSGVPTWKKSYTPLPGQNGCYNRCRPSCNSYNYEFGGCQPSCQSACNIRPSCGRRSQVQYNGSTMVCGRPGYNPQPNQGLYPQNQLGGGGWYDSGSNNWGQYYPQASQVASPGLSVNVGRVATNNFKRSNDSAVVAIDN